MVYSRYMDRLVYYEGVDDPTDLHQAVPAVEMTTVANRRSLVEALVGDPQLVGAIIELDELDASWRRFLESARRSFPLLPIVVIAPAGPDAEAPPQGVETIDSAAGADSVAASVARRVSVPRRPERREHHRFDWPLRASLVGTDEEHRIRELSAGGAFLVPATVIPPPGSTCDIRICFQNFTITTACEILDPRHTSSRHDSGFGVRFVSLSDEASAFIDRIVNDALAKLLLDPDSEPAVPSIDEEEEILAVGDEFALTL